MPGSASDSSPISQAGDQVVRSLEIVNLEELEREVKCSGS